MYDTHCHPYLAKEKSQDNILENFFNGGGLYLNTIGVDIPTNTTCVELAKKYPWVHATVGIHPTYTLNYREEINETIQELKKQYTENKEHIVAIGEAWLDYYWLDTLSEKYGVSTEQIVTIQKVFFIAQIRLSQEVWLPLVIHNRESSSDIFEILKQENCTNFVFHCFSEDLVFAKKLLDFSPECKLGFWGVTTFKSAKATMEVLANIPLKNIILETDSPYLTPTPYRWKTENEPLYVKYILDKVAELREESYQEIQEQILKNSCDFFRVVK